MNRNINWLQESKPNSKKLRIAKQQLSYSTFQKSDTNSIILIQPYFGLMKVRAMRSILQPNLIFKGAFGGLSKNMVSATT